MNDDRVMALWTQHGLLTEGLGPEAEWKPVPPDTKQTNHNAFWGAITPILTEAYDDDADDDDVPFWMSQRATRALISN